MNEHMNESRLASKNVSYYTNLDTFSDICPGVTNHFDGPVSPLATRAQLWGLIVPSTLPRLPQSFIRSHGDLGDVCLCSPAPDLRWHQILEVLWRWHPLLPQPCMGPCSPASLPALQALLLHSYCSFSIPRCCYCCSTVSSDSQLFLSPVPYCDGSPGP